MRDKILLLLWKNWKVILLTLMWITLSGLAVYYLLNVFFSDDQRLFLPNKTSDGHYQIEIACDACHTPFEGVKQEACLSCHAKELKRARDSHAIKKFKDPRNAEFLAQIDARLCVTCHQEHQQNMSAMAVTIADDFCFTCHQDIAKDRSSHKGMAFNACRECHNYHDNTALYEDFLEKHLDEPFILKDPLLPERNFLYFYRKKAKQPIMVLAEDQADAPVFVDLTKARDWLESSHSQAGVNCKDCHSKANVEWTDKPDQSYCQSCHKNEVKGFLSGKHGMRLAQDLPAMTTDIARQKIQHEEIKTLSCVACHTAHQFNTQTAAVEACLNCHKDKHSRAYKASAHFRLWRDEQKGIAAKNSGVSCASCHLPRIAPKKRKTKAKKPRPTKVQHNQNHNLKPNQKMLKDVCLRCHGLSFSLDSLADKEVIRYNFAEPSNKHLQSLEMVKKRINNHSGESK